MRASTRLFNSRLGRRLFLLFLACVGLPLTVMSTLTLLSVRQSRQEEVARISRETAKEIGLALYRGLLARVDAIEILSAATCEEGPQSGAPVYWSRRYEDQFSAIWRTDSSGRAVQLLGPQGPPPPALTLPKPDRRPRLIRSSSTGPSLALALTNSCGEREIASYVAILEPSSLFEPEAGLGVGSEQQFRVLDATGSPLFESMPAGDGGRSGEPSGGRRDLRSTDALGQWTLFLGGRFDAQNWQIEVLSPSAASHPLAGHVVANLLMVVLLGLASAVLASIAQIRRSLVPLDKLTSATRALAEGKHTRVGIIGDDEFGELARSFDEMASRLTEQFGELSRTAEELRGARDEAQAASRAKSDFLAMMSHEIRTPMNGILGMAELALDSGDSAEQRESLSVIRQSASALQRVLNDVLDYARMEAGRLEVEPADVSISDLVAGTCQLFRADLARRGIALQIQVSPDLEGTIRTDEGRVRQILLNLLGNASKFIARGRIDVSARRLVIDGRPRFEIAVADTGPGIPPERLRQVFEPFAQGEDYLRRKHGGTGLGLATCRKLAELLGGSIEVESEVGKGSRFRLVLPLEATEPTPAAADRSPRVEPPTPDRSACSVLVAEDNPVNQRVVERMLGREGCTVTVVPDGAQAVAAARDARFDLILMDIQMPVMDGLSATRSLRKEGCETPILALTAHALPSDHKRMLEAGIDEILTKPVSRDRLAQALQAFTRKPVTS